MKKRIIIISAVVAIVGFTAFSFVNKEPVNSGNDKPAILVVNELDSVKVDFGFKFPKTEKPRLNRNIPFIVRGRNGRPITKEKLKDVKLIGDAIPNFADNWIKDYRSVEIVATLNGEEVKAIGPNEVLTLEQKEIFSSADVADDINIIVNYKYKNSVTNDAEDRQMNVSITVMPEVEAEYIGGYDKMMAYLLENTTDEMRNIIQDKASLESSFSFTVNKLGEVDNVKLNKTVGDTEVDELLIELITKMPKWKPAESPKGSVVEQEFEFLVGMDGC